MSEILDPSEPPLVVFISSVMNNDEVNCAREAARDAINSIDFGRPWLFECTPASSEAAVEGYLRKVREADFVIWLVGRETTQPVADEINECITSEGRLLVLRLPSDQRDAKTRELLDTVSQIVKWQDIESVTQLPQHIKQALNDEVVRALRNPTPPLRKKKLRETDSLSVSRCRSAWEALDVPSELANSLAEDRALGNVLDFPTPGAYFVAGEQGAGKSLASERLLQQATQRALDNSSNPFPIYLSARGFTGSLPEYVKEECRGYADPFIHGVFLTVDGADELGVSDGNNLLQQIDAYAGANSNATIVVTGRPLTGLNWKGKRVAIPVLDEHQIVELIRTVSRLPLEANHIRAWPDSMKEVAKYPLFSVMIGSKMRDNPLYAFESRNQLIEQLAEDALGDASDNSEDLDKLLHVLAVRSITEGKPVSLHSVTTSWARQKILTSSRLVRESPGMVDFALPILREWYAARALLEGTISVKEIEKASDRWVIPPSLVLNSGYGQVIRSLMIHLTSTDPGLVSRLLSEHSREHESVPYIGQHKLPSLESELGVGKRIRESIETWRKGLGGLYLEVGPVDSDGSTKALGIGLRDRFIVTRWYHDKESESPIVAIPSEQLMVRSPEWSIYGMEVPNTEAWSWVFTRSYLVRRLSKEFANLNVAAASNEALQELCWDLALAVNGKGRFASHDLNVSDVISRMEELGLEDVEMAKLPTSSYSGAEIAVVKECLSDMLANGQNVISDPWPSFDQPFPSGGQIWQLYSRQQLLERTNAVYSAALHIYADVVRRWFNCFATRLPLYNMMPVGIEGYLAVPDSQDELRRGPFLVWRPRILPSDQRSLAIFELGLGHFGDREEEDIYFREEQDNFVNLRGGYAGDMQPLHVTSAWTDPIVSWDRPATAIAMDWLNGELRELDWL